MIITLKGANFGGVDANGKPKNIGTLSSWRISTVLGTGATYEGVTSVTRDPVTGLTATVTLDEGYSVSTAGVTVTMGGVDQGTGVYTIDGQTITITIASVTGNVVIKVPTVDASGNESGGNEDEAVTYNFPLKAVGIGVTSAGTGRIASATARLSNGSETEKLGILVPAGKTITLNGLTSGTYPLRFDYVYGTVNALNPVSGSTTAIEGLVGTASNYMADAYFPLNIEGADSYSITNTSDQDYYYWFVFAGLTKAEAITAEISTYNITYTISSSNISWSALPVTDLALGVTSTGTGRVTDNDTRLSTANTTKANGILIPAGKTIYLKGLASGTYPLRFDYVYGTVNALNPVSGSTTAIEGLVGTASNYMADAYFPINVIGADTCSVTNVYGSDYYFWFGFAGLNKTEAIKAELNTYNIKYYIA